jgi:uncharacterized membrane protein
MSAPVAMVSAVLLLGWPVLVYLGLGSINPLWLALLIPVTLLINPVLARLEARRPGRSDPRHRSPLQLTGWWLLVPTGVFLSLSLGTASEWALRLWPVIMNATVAALFFTSLHQSMTLSERIARMNEPDLPAEGVAYCRVVTWCWGLYMTLNALIAAWTVFIGSREAWLLFNGCISYLGIGVFFAVEYLIRQRVKRRVQGRGPEQGPDLPGTGGL